MVTTPDIKFPRAVLSDDARVEFELLGFWDGGKSASAAVTYIWHELVQPQGPETHSVRLLMAKARVTPTSPKVSNPRTELRGLLMLARLITSFLPGFSKLPYRISLFGDSQCTIAPVECDQEILEVWFGNRVAVHCSTILEVWFRNRVAEIRDHMHSWTQKQIQVDELHHWPGDSSIADLPTRGTCGQPRVSSRGRSPPRRPGLPSQGPSVSATFRSPNHCLTRVRLTCR